MNVDICLEEHCIGSWIIYGLKRGIPWQLFFGFSLFLFILCLTNVSNKYYHGTLSDKLSLHHKGLLIIVDWYTGVSAHVSDRA